MNSNIISLATLRLSVRNVLECSSWYRKFFECTPLVESETFASFKSAGACFDLAKADEKSPHFKGGSVGYWLVADFETTIQRAVALGAKIYRGPLKVPEIGRHIVQLEDPFGNIIGLEGND